MPPATESATPRRPRERTDSLNDVRSVIPAECYERSRGRAALALTQGAVLYAAPIVLLVLTDRWWAVPILWLLAGLGVAGLFVLGHDASHGALFPSRRANRTTAVLCMIPSVHIEAAWDLGHNRVHHGFTTREGFDFVWHPSTRDEYDAMPRRHRLRHRVEWSAVGSGAYYLRSVWWEKMWRFLPEGKRRRPVARDRLVLSGVIVAAVAVAAVFGALGGGVLGAIWLPTKTIVVPFLLFTHIIGWTVYVHHVSPSIRWWPRREWTQFLGQMESTTVLRIPGFVNRLWFHNIFVHVPHHVDTRIPFHRLPQAAAAIATAYPDTVRSSRASVLEFVRSARACKLYDFDAGTWLRYGDVPA